jgi:hypothetical protein
MQSWFSEYVHCSEFLGYIQVTGSRTLVVVQAVYSKIVTHRIDGRPGISMEHLLGKPMPFRLTLQAFAALIRAAESDGADWNSAKCTAGFDTCVNFAIALFERAEPMAFSCLC